MEKKLEEHQWTLGGKFICTKCGYAANEEESKFLAGCYWHSYSADIHVSGPGIKLGKAIENSDELK